MPPKKERKKRGLDDAVEPPNYDRAAVREAGDTARQFMKKFELIKSFDDYVPAVGEKKTAVGRDVAFESKTLGFRLKGVKEVDVPYISWEVPCIVLKWVAKKGGRHV